MQLTEEERKAIVVYRLEKAEEATPESGDTGDYDDFFDWTQEDVEPYLPKVEAYIGKIKAIINESF